MPGSLKATGGIHETHSDGEVVMESDETEAAGPGVPEPTNALFLPTTALRYESSNLAWSTDDHISEPEPFEIVEPEPFEPRRRRFDWVGWTGAVLFTICAVIALILALNGLFNYTSQRHIAPPRGTTPQTTWREPPWVYPLPSAPSPGPVPSITP
jgi:hypothetical protein